MRKILSLIMALMLVMSMMATASAEELSVENELTVGMTTRLSGGFFTEMWGNNSADADVRLLLHGYNLMKWDGVAGCYALDESVVSGMVGIEDGSGDRTYTIVLYDDLKYSDGTKITASDYAFSMLLSLSPEVAAIGGAVNDADYIVGAEAYKSGESKVLSGVHVTGERQLSVTVKGEYLPYFYEMALLNCNPYPIHEIAPGCEVADDGEGVYIRNVNPDAEEDVFTAELLQKTILDGEEGYLSHPDVVSGPYRLVSFDMATGVAEFEINEYYKGNAAGEQPTIGKLTVKPVENESMIMELLNGQVGLLNKCVKADTITEGMGLMGLGEAEVANYTRSGYSFISYSCEQPTTGSKAVRQAIAHCFDKDSFVSEYVQNYGMRVDGYYGIGQWMYQMVAGSLAVPENPDAAAAENADATENAENAEEALDDETRWANLSLENLKKYEPDAAAAEALLEADGWVLNDQGGAFEKGKDSVRCKEIDGELVSLRLDMIYPEGNEIGAYAEGEFKENLKAVGIELNVEAKPFEELLKEYYRQNERESELIYLATNFSYVYEPSETFSTADAYQGENNRTGIVDEELYRLAVEMRKTEPGDLVSYCEKWVAFQEYYSDVLPTLPVYSNVYFDFYTPMLKNYEPAADVSWAEAIVAAYLSDEVEADDLFGDDWLDGDMFLDDTEELEFID